MFCLNNKLRSTWIWACDGLSFIEKVSEEHVCQRIFACPNTEAGRPFWSLSGHCKLAWKPLSSCTISSIWNFPFLSHQIQIWTYHLALLTCAIRPVNAFMVFLVSFFPVLLLLHLSQTFVLISHSRKWTYSLKARILEQRLRFIHLLWQLKCKLFIIHNVLCTTDYCCIDAKCKEIVIWGIKWYKSLLQHCFCSVLDQKWLKGSHFGCKVDSN